MIIVVAEEPGRKKFQESPAEIPALFFYIAYLFLFLWQDNIFYEM